MDAAQKRVIFGEALLLPVDAIVEAKVMADSGVEIGPGETHWSLLVYFLLTVSHINFPKGERWFMRRFAKLPTGQVKDSFGFYETDRIQTFGGFTSQKVEAYSAPHVKATYQAFCVVAPKLQNFIVDEYAAGEVSLERIVEFFNQNYKAPPAPTPRKSSKKIA